MLTAEQIAALRDYAGKLTDPINDYLIRDIAERIAKAGQFTSTAQYQIWAAQQMGLSQTEIKKRLKKLLGVSNDEIKKLLTQSAEVGYRFDLKALPTADAIPFSENHVLQEIVSAAVKLSSSTCSQEPRSSAGGPVRIVTDSKPTKSCRMVILNPSWSRGVSISVPPSASE